MFDIFWYDNPNNIHDLIKEKRKVCKTEYFWLANTSVDYSAFNWRWMPRYHQKQYCHAWPSHANEEFYTTYFIPFNEDMGIVHHKDILPVSDNKYYDICCIDTKTHSIPTCDFTVNLITTMQTAIEQAVTKTNKAWLWIVSDICEYDNFNFSWLPSNHDLKYVHCWPSGMCEKGDTFLINVNAYKDGNREFNFNHEPIKRKPWPIINYSFDNLAQACKNKSTQLYALYSKEVIDNQKIYDVCIWDKRPIVSLNESNSASLIPRDCNVEKEIYEYPYLIKKEIFADVDCDIIFMSYDELNADEKYQKLLQKYPHLKRVHGVDGMENALKQAAKISSTDYFYVIFAKTNLHEKWNFKFKPDYWRDPRNYIFYAINCSNDLIYGEMGIVLYNKNFLLNINSLDDLGVDLTMSFPVQVVPEISAYGEFATDPYRAWRTAFRETCKLAYFNYKNPCVETQYRINIWKTKAHGEFFKDVLRGANDGFEYFENNKNDLFALKKTFDWNWLRGYHNSKYNQ